MKEERNDGHKVAGYGNVFPGGCWMYACVVNGMNTISIPAWEQGRLQTADTPFQSELHDTGVAGWVTVSSTTTLAGEGDCQEVASATVKPKPAD